MPDKLSFRHLPPDAFSHYSWINIDRENVRVGKVRSKVCNDILIIYSITIFPEFERKNYGTRTIERFKEEFDTIIADRVRPKATGFWEKMGFVNYTQGSFIFRNQEHYS